MNKLKIVLISQIFLFLLHFVCFSTTMIEVPIIKKIKPVSYGASSITNDILFDSLNNMILANNKGVFVYNGENTFLYKNRNSSYIKSLHIKNDTLYVGGQREFGFFYKKPNNQLEYFSLFDSIPDEHRFFDDVWNVFSLNNQIIYHSGKALFFYDKKKITVFTHPKGTSLSCFSTGKEIITVINDSLFKVYKDRTEFIDWDIPFFKSNIISITTHKKNYVVVSKKGHLGIIKNGKYEAINSVQQEKKKHNILCSSILSEERIAIGTEYNGVYIYDFQGNIINHINYRSGLFGNSVSKIYPSKEKDGIWVIVKNGVNFIPLNSQITKLNPNYGISNFGYASLSTKEKLYLGTDQKLVCHK